MNDWQSYEAFKKHLLRAPEFQQDATRQYRLIYTVQGADPLWADLIPFGGVEHLPDTIGWPPDLGVLMNVAGYDEALRAAIQVQIAADCTISVASIPGLVITKIVAWNDRRSSTSKDALNIAYLLGNYADAGNVDRLYGEDIFVLEACGYDIACAGARLLGRDIVAIASAETCATLLAILEDQGRFESLVLGAASHRYLDEASGDAVRRLFQELVVGLK